MEIFNENYKEENEWVKLLSYGKSWSRKTYSLRKLNAKETFYIDADGKGLNWKGWKNDYNVANKNYFRSDDPSTILNC